MNGLFRPLCCPRTAWYQLLLACSNPGPRFPAQGLAVPREAYSQHAET